MHALLRINPHSLEPERNSKRPFSQIYLMVRSVFTRTMGDVEVSLTEESERQNTKEEPMKKMNRNEHEIGLSFFSSLAAPLIPLPCFFLPHLQVSLPRTFLFVRLPLPQFPLNFILLLLLSSRSSSHCQKTKEEEEEQEEAEEARMKPQKNGKQKVANGKANQQFLCTQEMNNTIYRRVLSSQEPRHILKKAQRVSKWKEMTKTLSTSESRVSPATVKNIDISKKTRFVSDSELVERSINQRNQSPAFCSSCCTPCTSDEEYIANASPSFFFLLLQLSCSFLHSCRFSEFGRGLRVFLLIVFSLFFFLFTACQCFFDDATPGTKISGSFHVASGGFLDIDVKVALLLYWFCSSASPTCLFVACCPWFRCLVLMER